MAQILCRFHVRGSGTSSWASPQSQAECRHSSSRSCACSASKPGQEHSEPAWPRVSRRQGAVLGALWALSNTLPAHASERGLQRYIKRKQLDPLESYVPAVLSAQDQLQAVGDLMGVDAAQARYLLRHGAFDTVRDSIKAIGEYAATEDLSPSEASSLVDTVFRRLQDLDYVFFHAQKIGQQPDLNQAEAKLADASGAINKLLATVPGPVLEKGREVARAVQQGRVDSMSKGSPQPAASLADRLKDLVPQS